MFNYTLLFSDTMNEFVFVLTECETVDVKEECVEEEDPLSITYNSDRGNWDLTELLIRGNLV